MDLILLSNNFIQVWVLFMILYMHILELKTIPFQILGSHWSNSSAELEGR